MVRVPRESLNRVEERGIPNIRFDTTAPIEAFGGGQALEETSSQVRGALTDIQEISDKETKRANEAWLIDADNQIKSLQHELERQGEQVRGKDAAGVTDSARKRLQEKIEEIKKSAVNDVQRDGVFRLGTASEAELLDFLNDHTAKEFERYEDNENRATRENHKNSAGKHFRNPQRTASDLEKIKEAAEIWAENKGLGPEARKTFIEGEMSDAHSRVLDGILNNGQDVFFSGKDKDGNDKKVFGYDYAKSYLEAHRDEMKSQDIERFQEAIEQGNVASEAQRFVDDLVSRNENISDTDDLSNTEMLAQLNSIEDPALRKEAKAQWKNRMDEQKRAKAADDAKRFEELSVAIEHAPGRRARDVVGMSTWTSLTQSERNALDRRASILAGQNVNHNSAAWIEFNLLSPEKMGNLSQPDFINKYWSRLSPEKRDKALSMYSKAVNKDPESFSLFTEKEIIMRELVRAKIDIPGANDLERGGKLSPDQAEFVDRFNERMEDRVDRFITNNNGRKPNKEQFEALVKEEIGATVLDPGLFSDTQTKIVEIPVDERGRFFTEDIPEGGFNSVWNLLDERQREEFDNDINNEEFVKLAKRVYAAYLKFQDRELVDEIIREVGD